MYDLAENDDFDREMVATYEEVSKLYPRPGVYRPIVLVGAPGVGRNELIKMLISKDPEKYRCPVPCKSVCTLCTVYCSRKTCLGFLPLRQPYLDEFKLI